MNALIAKEMRLLLPAYGMALVLAVIPVWLFPEVNQPVADSAIGPIWLGAVLLALSTFGREFGLKTFPLLLAQPLERRRIWWTKTGVLAGAMATVLIAWYLSCATWAYVGPERAVSLDRLIVGGTAAVVAFAGGLWTTLLLRQVVAAFWFTMLVPGAILMATLMATDISGGTIPTLFVAMLVYSVAGFLWAWRLFLRAQEVGWTGGIVNISGWWRSADAAARPSLRVHRPLAALCWKELQLHQIGLAGMGCLFALHLGVVALRHAGYPASGSMMGSALEVFGGIWLIVPLVAASSSVAEERKLGTLDGQLCLPISSRVQFAVKLLFVLVLGGLLSAVLLWTAEGIGSAVGAGSHFKVIPFGREASLVFLALSLIGFYASTLARNVIQALATAVVTTLGVGMLGSIASNPLDAFGLWLWQGALVYYIGWSTLVAIFVWLAWRNFRCVSESGRLWRRNALGLIGALIFIATFTSAIYHRAWELITPIESAHGPARVVGAKPTILHDSWNGELAALLPSGELWVDRIMYDPGRPWQAFGLWSTRFRMGGKWTSLSGNHIVAGSNWVDAAAYFGETVAIRSDGTLWVSEKPRQAWNYYGKGIPPAEEPAGLVRFGDETNWQSVTWNYSFGSRPAVLLTKNDGTLWRWSGTTNSVGEKQRKWPGLRSFQPQRLGTESDWARIMPAGGLNFIWKRDGRAWVLHPSSKPHPPQEIELEPGTVIERLESCDNLKWQSLTPCWPLHVAVREDGTLWTWRFLSGKKGGGLSMRPPVQIGKDSNWVAVVGHYHRLVALKTDGSIWQWNYYRAGRPRWGWNSDEFVSEIWLTKVSPVRLGTHADWAAIGSLGQRIVSLAADGSLWCWWDRDPDWRSEYASQPLLAPSRKPAKIENIFGRQE